MNSKTISFKCSTKTPTTIQGRHLFEIQLLFEKERYLYILTINYLYIYKK